jgi:hypothetical protein
LALAKSHFGTAFWLAGTAKNTKKQKFLAKHNFIKITQNRGGCIWIIFLAR